MNNIKQIRKQQGLTITELSQKIGMSQANLTKIENNQIELRTEIAQKISKVLNVSISSLTTTTDSNTIELINPEQYLLPKYSSWQIPPHINLDKTTKGYIMPDDTMSPTIEENSICLFNTTQTELKNGIFLIKQDNNFFIRRLQISTPDNIFILTDNKSYIKCTVSTNDIQIIGKITHVISTFCVK